MGEREIDARLEELKKQGKKIYSISRLNTLNQCEYQAYLNYIKEEPQKNIGIYGKLGGKVHDTIEACLLGNAKPEDLKKAIQDELDDLEMCGIEFPKDKNGNSAIRNNWVANMTRFAEEFTTPKGEFKTEELLILPIDEDHYMQGYADAIRFDKKDKNTVWLIDWKTSSDFKGAHLIEAGRQLVLYKLALEKLGYKVKRTSWCMLKYCTVKWTQKNGKEKTKVCEWRNLIKDNENTITKFLEEEGMDEIDIECLLQECKEKNSLLPLPVKIWKKFTVSIYVRDYEITDDIIDETLDYIKNSINKYETYGDDEDNYKPCDCAKESYFCNALCGYGGKSGQCKYYVDYLNTFDKAEKSDEDEDDLF